MDYHTYCLANTRKYLFLITSNMNLVELLLNSAILLHLFVVLYYFDLLLSLLIQCNILLLLFKNNFWHDFVSSAI